MLAQAEDEAKRLKDDYISIEHILLAMTDDGGATGRILKEFGITLWVLLPVSLAILVGAGLIATAPPARRPAQA